MVGGLIGGVLGAAVGAFGGGRLLSLAGLLWSLCGAVLGALPVAVVGVLNLPTQVGDIGVSDIALIIMWTLVPGGAVLGLEVGKRLRKPSQPGKN